MGRPPVDFGFVVHPLAPAQRRLMGLRYSDGRLIRGLPAEPTPRILAELSLAAPGRTEPLRGVLVSVPLLTDELLGDQEAGVAAVADAVRLCQGRGARVVGLGAVAAVIGGQGKAVAQAVPEVAVTTGNGVTALAAADTVGLWRAAHKDTGPIGLLGPPGPVANAVLELLAARGEVLRVVSPKPPLPLRRLADQINAAGYGRVEFVEDAAAVLSAGQILVAASSTGGRLRRSALPAGSVVIDVAAPQDVLLDGPARADVRVLDGEYVRLPAPLAGSAWQQIYRWVTHQGRAVFGCFAEPMLLALAQRPDLASVGRSVPLDRLLALGALMERCGFWVAEIHAHGRPIRQLSGDDPGPGAAAALPPPP